MTKFVWAENWQDLCGRADDYFQPETGENNMDEMRKTQAWNKAETE